MKVTLADTSHHAVYLSDDGGGTRLAYILKRLLLSHSNSEGATVQIAVVQSIVLLLNGPRASSFAVAILKADTAGELLLFTFISTLEARAIIYNEKNGIAVTN